MIATTGKKRKKLQREKEENHARTIEKIDWILNEKYVTHKLIDACADLDIAVETNSIDSNQAIFC